MAVKSVLIIEDDAELRRALRGLLERRGYAVTEAFEGGGGVDQFNQTHPDLVVVDVLLPDLDGWQAFERIRTMTDNVGVLMLGIEGDEGGRLNAYADDYLDCLTKPVSQSRFLARVVRLSRIRREFGEA
jgi:DNA-binding response OmpR family regulator